MKVSNLTLSQALFESVQAKPNSKKLIIANLIKKLRKNHQLKRLPAIIRDIETIENKNVIQISSAFNLSETNQAEIEKIAQKTFPKIDQPKFFYQVDKNLIGGFKMINNSREIDFTLDNYLTQFKENLWKKI
jgi:F0F1-type ATP synthase delta subunit